MTHPCIASTAATISALRTANISGRLDADTRLSPSVYFSSDDKGGTADVTLYPHEGGLINAEIKVTGHPGWLSLNIGLGTGAFNEGDTLGIITDIRGTDTFNIRPYIRSSRNSDEQDTILSKDITFGGTPTISTLLHTVSPADALPHDEAYHTLILPLPIRDLSLVLNDLCLFHLGAESGLSEYSMTLGRLAG
ncbi:hypothetical protein GGR95_003551 [Sulfitobacter undariae]|uniref:Uncharacterized protein n=1 Tax=Sulfitobacter undariae TaxID=1563671 RepID=A0A7W6H1T5_9RHOB|nr:hypothetical protein [Sulfitobacter undariae]MBB3995885.1 hypothetical protein [Sulfitobacter undariae]